MQLPSNKRTGLLVVAAVAVVAITAVTVVATTTRADRPPALLPPTPCGTSTGKGCGMTPTG